MYKLTNTTKEQTTTIIKDIPNTKSEIKTETEQLNQIAQILEQPRMKRRR